MRKSILSALFILIAGVSIAQNSISATYSAAIPTSFGAYDASCTGPSSVLNVTLPAGDNYVVTSVDVTYAFEATAPGLMSHQRSLIYCENTNTAEAAIVSGTGGSGTQVYTRNISIANGAYAGGTELVFQMAAFRTLEGTAGCNTSVNRINAGTWIITVNYSNEILNRKVGINTATPKTALHVNGKLKLGNDTNVPEAGMVRWNATTNDFEGYNGTEWISFTKNATTWGTKDGTENSSNLASDGAVNDEFGHSVSISGDYAIVGAYGKLNLRGKAYIFKRIGSLWVEEAGLIASDGGANNSFGVSVSISGNYAIVGASEKGIGGNPFQGKAYIFIRSGTVWTEQAGLVASDGAANDGFGISVSISGNYVIVGAQGKTIVANFQGKAYIFKRSGTVWTEEAGLVHSDGAANDHFGISVSISGDYAIVGSRDHDIGANSNQGKAYIFKRSGTVWTEQAGLVASDGTVSDYFGKSVSVDGDYAIVGANGKDSTYSDQGKAYIFKRSGTAWAEQAGFVASDAGSNNYFGSSVSISGDYAIVGAYGNNVGGNPDQGKAYIFKRLGTSWTEQADIVGLDGAALDYFGVSVSISGDYVIVGADGKTSLKGKVYFFNK